MNYRLEITLLSAVSPGSGEGWAGMIDSDIMVDELGIPYIPARRLKGILREMAEDVVGACAPYLTALSPPLSSHDICELFGEPGQQISAVLRIENACIENYHELRKWIRWAQATTPEIFTPERIIQSFAHLRQQTAIDGENGVAMPGSLRTTRVLNRNLKFFSGLTINHQNLRLETLLALAVTVTRYLGSKRNRGLGKVVCRLLTVKGKDITAERLEEVAEFF